MRTNYKVLLVIISLSILATAVYMYKVSGMPIFCDCTYLNFWNGFAEDAGNSQRLIDWYTLSHIVSGILLVLIVTPFIKKKYVLPGIMFAVVVSALWEIIESTDYIIFHFRTSTISRDYIGDSILNAVSDIVALALGMLMALKVRTTLLIAFIIIVELASYYFIHDNLTLNILSFILPQFIQVPFFNLIGYY